MIDAMRKIIALALPLLFLSLMIIQANAVVTPVEVQRAKDVYFVKVKGDHRTKSFLFSYENLSPDIQDVTALFATTPCDPLPCEPPIPYSCVVTNGESLQESFAGDYGYTLDFTINIHDIAMTYAYTIEGSVVIPPPP